MPSRATRTEHDLLGDKAVPADAYFGVQTARALENFNDLNPQKARVLLRLALLKPRPATELQRIFMEY